MLVEFRVTNYLSFKEEQIFTMVKSKANERQDNSFVIQSNKNFSLLKSTAIYGPNSSGKSNFLKALLAMKTVVTNPLQRGNSIPVTPFKLNSETVNQPTEFEVSFIVDDIKYQYGFSASSQHVFDEWLFAFPAGRPQKWFERVWDYESKKHLWRFSQSLTGAKKLWKESTRDNALFLSTAVQLNSEQLKPVFDWFNNTLRIVMSDNFSPNSTADYCNTDGKSEVLKFLKAADFNISDIKVDKIDTSAEQKFEVNTIHVANDGIRISFNFKEESTGTQKFFSFAEPILKVLNSPDLNKGAVLCIDELNVNLHPKLVKFLVELFHDKKINKNNAQLLFTTHETSILTQEIFRRDQVWFCDKDKEQCSILYPISDFSPKKDKSNLELGYLSGRYGALPLLRSFSGEL